MTVQSIPLPYRLGVASRPAFIITIDTEGDNLWARTHSITTKNAAWLIRFQSLCERYRFKPTYLTNWEMVNCPVFCEFAADALRRNTAEVGMHLHAWNSPPLVPLTEDDYVHHPYLIEYPEHLIREKVKVMTATLEERFGRKMLSHRAGRFAFNEIYARILVEHGYQVDGSVTPGISWEKSPGDPNGKGGSDYSRFPHEAYFVDLEDISRPGNSSLLEVPVTIMRPHFSPLLQRIRSLLQALPLGRRVARRLFPQQTWLYPKGKNHRLLPPLLRAVCGQERDFAEFMIHSSELMPGGSPNYPSPKSIEALYDALELLFSLARDRFDGCTLSEYDRRFRASHSIRAGGGPRSPDKLSLQRQDV